jgi:hypothetical protein
MNNLKNFTLNLDDDKLSMDWSAKGIISGLATAVGFIGFCWLVVLVGVII